MSNKHAWRKYDIVYCYCFCPVCKWMVLADPEATEKSYLDNNANIIIIRGNDLTTGTANRWAKHYKISCT